MSEITQQYNLTTKKNTKDFEHKKLKINSTRYMEYYWAIADGFDLLKEAEQS